MLRIGTMNMLIHNVENPQIAYRDLLSKSNTDRENHTLVLANPPFKGSLDAESVAEDLLRISDTKRTEILFLSLMLRILKNGGVISIFKDKVNIVKDIVSIIDEVNGRLIV